LVRIKKVNHHNLNNSHDNHHDNNDNDLNYDNDIEDDKGNNDGNGNKNRSENVNINEWISIEELEEKNSRLFEYLVGSIELMADLCYCRNYIAIEVLQNIY
jgi:hypothetical protein